MPRMRVSRAVRLGELLGPEAQPVHARVELEPGAQRFRPAARFEQRELLEAVHHQIEAELTGLRKLLGREHAFEQQHALLESRGAQHEAFLESCDSERVARRQRPRHRHEPVPVGVRLDHRHHARPWRKRAHPREVVAQRGRIHDRPDLDPRSRRHCSWPYAPLARLSNRVYLPRNVRCTSPVGPFRCLAMMMSAMPLRGVSGSYTSSR